MHDIVIRTETLLFLSWSNEVTNHKASHGIYNSLLCQVTGGNFLFNLCRKVTADLVCAAKVWGCHVIHDQSANVLKTHNYLIKETVTSHISPHLSLNFFWVHLLHCQENPQMRTYTSPLGIKDVTHSSTCLRRSLISFDYVQTSLKLHAAL